MRTHKDTRLMYSWSPFGVLTAIILLPFLGVFGCNPTTSDGQSVAANSTLEATPPKGVLASGTDVYTVKVTLLDSANKPLTKKVTLQSDRNLSGAAVVDTMTPASVVTDAKGVAEFKVSSKKVGKLKITAVFEDVASATKTTLSKQLDLDFVAGPPQKIDVSPDSLDQKGRVGTALKNPFLVSILDAYGNKLLGESVKFTIQSGDAKLSNETATTTTENKAVASTLLTFGNKAGEVLIRVDCVSSALPNTDPVLIRATSIADQVAALDWSLTDAALKDGIDENQCERMSVLFQDASANAVNAAAGTTLNFSDEEQKPRFYFDNQCSQTLANNQLTLMSATNFVDVFYKFQDKGPIKKNITVSATGLTSKTVALQINHVNQSPVNLVPSVQTMNEDGVLSFSVAGGNSVSVFDAENTLHAPVVDVSVEHGVLSVSALALSDLQFSVGSGTADKRMVFSGTWDSINVALSGLVYAPNLNYFGADVLTLIATDNSTEHGGSKSDTDTVAISINSVNDAPTIGSLAAQTIQEDQGIVFSAANANAIVVNDLDALNDPIQVSLSCLHGDLSLASVDGLSFTQGDGSHDANLVFSGTVNKIGIALAALSYQPQLNYFGSDKISIVVDDLGHSGMGVAYQVAQDINVTIDSVNDAPVLSVPAAQNTNEDLALVFSSANHNAISVSDVDALDADKLTVSLSASGGKLTLASTSDLTFELGTGVNDTSVRFSGAIAKINAALNGLSFAPNANESGNFLLDLTVNDTAHNGSGGEKTDSQQVGITVAAVNDAPVWTKPGVQSTAEDTPLLFSTSSSNSISLADVDVGVSPLTIDLSATQAVLSLSSTTGLSFTSGDGAYDSHMTFSGTLLAINAALEGLSFLPNADYNGTSTITLNASDNGVSGSGGVKTDTQSITVNIAPMNDAPINTAPLTQTIDEDQNITFVASGPNAITVADVDAANANIKLSLSVDQGTLTLSTLSGLTIDSGSNASSAVAVIGTLSKINAALDGLVYAPPANYHANATITVISDDLGNIGAGGHLTDSDTILITINSINDPPVLSLALAQSLNEDNTLVFSVAGGKSIVLADADAGTDPLSLDLSVSHGTLTLASTSGLSGSTAPAASLSISGSLSHLNAALDGLIYAPSANYNGTDTMTLLVNDLAHNGPDGAKTDTKNVTLTINAVNDSPVNSVATAQTMNEDATLTFSTGNSNLISIADVDADSADLQLSLDVLHGTLTLSGVAGLTAVSGNGSGSVSLTGPINAVNTALAGLVYAPAAQYNGSDTLTVTTSDLGSTGSGGVKTDVDTVAITIDAVNDAPVNTVPAAQSMNEDATLTFSSGNSNLISIDDVDVGSADLQVSLSVLHGSLTLSGVAGLSAVSGNGSGSVSLTGPINAVNTALAGLMYAPVAQYNGSDTFTITTSDLGNTGSGGIQTDVDTVAIAVNAVNDAPVNTVAPAQSMNEDATLVLSSGGGNVLSVSDIDASSSSLQVSLSVSHGTLSLASIAGLDSVSGNASSSVILTGGLTVLNNALNGLQYIPAANYNGSDTLTMTTSDLGNTGSGGAQIDTDTVSITINAVNDAPVNSVASAQTMDENTTLVFSLGNGNLISISDPDGASTDVSVALTVTHGVLHLSGTTGLTLTGGAYDSATMTFHGSVTNINAALAGMSYVPATNYNGLASLTINLDDQGNVGGGSLTDSDSVSITLLNVNDPPINSVPSAQTVAEESTLTFSSGNSNLISISDLDIGSDNALVTLSVSHGTLTLGSLVGLSFTMPADGVADASMTFTGTLSSINTALDGLYYTPSSDYAGSDTLSMVTSDQGSTGPGGTKTDTDTVAITVTPVNDAPVNTVPGLQTTAEDTNITFSSGLGNAVSVSDVDAASTSLVVTLSATHGSLTLSTTAGLTHTTGDGTLDANMQFSGTLTAINTALSGLVYTPDANYFGADTITLVVNDQGNVGSGGSLSDTDTIAVTITSVNDAPVNSMPAAQTVAEEGTLLFSSGNGNLISTTDVDAASNLVLVSLSVTQGRLTLSGTTGLTFSVGSGVSDSSMIFDGTLTNVNAALAGMTYVPNVNVNGADTLTLIVNDQGFNGSGGNKSDTDLLTITVTGVNDAPVNTVPGAQTINEDATLTFSSGAGNQILIADVDANISSVAVSLSVTGSGTLTLSGVTGLTFTSGSNAASSMTFTGTVTNINNALNGLVYTPVAQSNGSFTLTILTNDQGNTGSGGALSDTDTVSITVNAVDDAPVNTVPGAQSINEDATLTFSSGAGTAVSVADIDAASSNIQTQLTVLHGTLTLADVSGVTVTAGSNASATLTMQGTVTQINTALASIVYAPTANYNGADTLTVATSDLGNTGSGGPLTDTDTVAMTVNAVNDAPVNSLPVAQSTNEDTNLVLSTGNSNLISVSDTDVAEAPGNLQITLSVSHGTFSLSGIAGLSFTTGDGTSDTSMVFSGTALAINAALDGLTYAPTANYNGTDTLSISTSDQGSTGSGGTQTDTDALAITVDAVNDAPVNTVPGVQTINEDATLTFSSGAGTLVSIADVDAGSSNVQVQLSVDMGTLTLSGLTGLTFTVGDGTADAAMTFTGTVSDINNALSGMIFNPGSNNNGVATLTMITNDQGNTGSGGAHSDTDTVTINVTAVNDAPVNSVPAAQTMNEDAMLTFSSGVGNLISIADVDAGAPGVRVQLTVDSGTLTLSGTTGLSLNAGSNGSASMTYDGTVTDLNSALSGMVFNPGSNNNGTVTLTILTSDLGNTGSGGTLTDTDTVTITVNAVNDAPVNSVPAAQSLAEGATKTFSSGAGTQISVADVDATTLQVTISVAQGTFTLSGTTGLTFTTGDGTSDASMVFTGTPANINTAMNGTVYTPNTDYYGADTLTITTSDAGQTGSGGTQTDTDTVAITVTGVNDAPVITVPSAQTAYEDTDFTFSSGDGTAVSVADADGVSTNIQTELVVTHGTMTLASTSGLTFSVGDGTLDATMTFTGTVTDTNTALEGMTYLTDLSYSGAETLTINVSDQGNTGAGGTLTDSDTVSLTVLAVNDAPVNSMPAAQTTNEDTSLTLSTGNGNLISISDSDANADSVRMTLTATNGTLTLAGTGGLSFTTGDGTSDTTMTFTGTIANINTAIDGLVFAPTANYNGAASIVVTTNDLGKNGVGGAKSDTDTLVVTVSAVNDTPSIAVGGAQNINEDATITFSGGDLISVTDVDASSAGVQVQLTVSHGTLSLSGISGLTFSVGDGTSDATMTFTGTVTDVNTALASMVYTPTANYNGADSLAVDVSDLGHTGSGGILTDSDSVSITLSAVNDAPVNNLPSTQTINEDSTLTFSVGNGNLISITDVDSVGANVHVTLTVTGGVLTLSGTAGLTNDAGASGTATMEYHGTLSSINTALAGMVYTPTANANGSRTLTISVDDNGDTGSGGNGTDSDVLNITVTAVNDAPVNTVPGAQSTTEDSGVSFSTGFGNPISVSDTEATTLQLSLSVSHGVLTLAGTTGLTFSVGDGSLDSSMTFSGLTADIDTALDGLLYSATANYNGTDTLVVASSDLGSTGTGGTQTDTDNITITISAVNDAPVLTVPGAQTMNEDATLTFSAGVGNTVSLADVDASTDPLQITITTTNGTATLSTISGLSFSTGDGTADTLMVFTGTLTTINNALSGMTFTPNSNYNGAGGVLQIDVDDQGYNGAGGNLTDSETIGITVNAVNDAPVNTVPGAQSIAEDGSTTFSTGTGNGIVVADQEAASLQVEISVSHGVLTLAGTGGLVFSVGDGSLDATMTFTGSPTDINNALDGLFYSATADYNGADTLTIVTSDLGSSGSGGTLTDTDTVTINISAVNDAPIVLVPGGQTISEDNTVTFSSGAGTQVSLVDNDSASSSIQAEVSVSNGIVTLASTTGLTFTVGANASASMTVTGTLANINTALNGMVYTPTLNYNGADTLTVNVSDLGNTGSGGTLTDSDTVAITINAVNDAPVASLPSTQSINEDSVLTISTGNSNLISASDVDVAGSSMYITVSSSHGTVTLNTMLMPFAGSNSSYSVTYFTSIANINTALDGMTFTADANFNGTGGITIMLSDNGNTGSGGNLSDAQTLDVTVNSINDTPVNTVPGAQSTTEDGSITFASAFGTGISVADSDATTLSVQLTVLHGALTLSGTTGLTFSVGDGTADSSMTFVGTASDINTALNGTIYTPTANYNGSDTLTLVTSDQGSSGSGGTLTDTDTVALTITAVNDAPVITVPGAQTVNEDTNLTFSTGNSNLVSVSDVDIASSSFSVVLSVTNGTLTLSQTTGLTFSVGDGTTDVSMTFTGNSTNVNAALAGLIYAPTANYNGAATLSVDVDDQGATGAGGNLTDSQTVAITVSAVNDTPVNTVPAAQSSFEDTSLTFNAGNSNTISIADIDAAGASVQVTLSVSHGSLTLSGTGGLTFSSGDGTSDASMTFTATVSDANAAIDGLVYTPDANYAGADTLSVVTNDQGNTGSGGSQSDTDTVTITSSAVNDEPVNSVPSSQTVINSGTLTFSTGNGNLISVNDVDVSSSNIRVTLGVDAGSLTLSQITGLTFTAGDGTADASMVFRGTLSNVNAALAGLIYTPAVEVATRTLTITSYDFGNTGIGGPQSDTDTVSLSVTTFAPVAAKVDRPHDIAYRPTQDKESLALGMLELAGHQELVEGLCSQAYTLTLKDQAGQPMALPRDLTVDLNVNENLEFFSDADCQMPVKSLRMPMYTSQKHVFAKALHDSVIDLKANADGYVQAALQVHVEPVFSAQSVSILQDDTCLIERGYIKCFKHDSSEDMYAVSGLPKDERFVSVVTFADTRYVLSKTGALYSLNDTQGQDIKPVRGLESSVKAVFAADLHGLCAVMSDGVRCLGIDHRRTHKTEPVLVEDVGYDVQSVVFSAQSTCFVTAHGDHCISR